MLGLHQQMLAVRSFWGWLNAQQHRVEQAECMQLTKNPATGRRSMHVDAQTLRREYVSVSTMLQMHGVASPSSVQ